MDDAQQVELLVTCIFLEYDGDDFLPGLEQNAESGTECCHSMVDLKYTFAISFILCSSLRPSGCSRDL